MPQSSHEALLDQAIAAAEQMAARPAAAFAITKQQWRAPTLEIGCAKDDVNSIGRIEEIWSSPETLETIRGYIERTFKKPR
jgi:enoyl-CoA hydratase/carnithine racemase